MTIFDNIWNILTTENIIITNIITSPFNIFEAWLGFLIFSTLLNITYTKSQKYIYILLLTIICILSIFIIPSPFNIFFNYIALFLLIKLNFKLNFIKTILSITLPTVIFALANFLILKPFLLVFKITPFTIQTVPLYNIIYLTLEYGLILISITLIKYFKIKILLKEEFDNKNKKIITINLLSGIFIICIQLIISSFYSDILPFYISILNFISLFAYFFITLYSLIKTMKLQIATKNLESVENYNATLTYLYDNVKAFQHDFNNMVFIMEGYITANDINGLKNYYKNLKKDCEKVNNIALLNPKLINNSGIYNLLNAKYKKAHEFNINIHLEYFFDLEKLKMPIYEFSRILGILLDNAIESAKETEEKQINIIFRDSSLNHTQIITIENSFINKNIDTTKIFEKGITEKNNHSGMGLWEVSQIIKRIHNINLITKINTKYFIQSLEIYY